MNRIFLILASLLLSFVVYGFYISQFEFRIIPITKKTEGQAAFLYDYKIAFDVYSNLSSGSGNVLTIAEEAKKSHLNFVLISDTNSYYDLDTDKYLSDVGILSGAKVSDDKRFFIYYSPTQKAFFNKTSKDFAKDEDALIIESHPINTPYELTQLTENKFDGLEVLNFKSIAQKSWRESRLSTMWSLLYYPFNPRLALTRLYKEPSAEIAVFDQLSQLKKVNFFVGAEATARAIPFADWLVKFPSYEMSFNIASQHIFLTSELTGDISNDAHKVLTALKNGHSYVAFDALGDPAGFEVYMTENRKKFFTGDDIAFTKNLRLYYKLPAEPIPFYEVVLFKNGQRIDHLNTFEGLFAIESPGVYRIQVRLSPTFPLPDATKWITWVYTNNFYVNPK
ncbi:hypothetical protein CIK05_15605 [Bdellovibrio sp. qaytius]|nr:hypothetical protein CIK05_15605 [Bdellovibrio sp. qaytius]